MLKGETGMNKRRWSLAAFIFMVLVLCFSGCSRSLIIVTNRPMSEWTKMGVDKHLAETLRTRLMAGAQLIHLK